MIGKTNAGGGGSTALNFKVVGGGTAPSNPSENMIWVNTGNAITGWVFSATAPSSPTTGLVWIRTGTSATAPFNALKKNGIMVYPVATMQYVGGTWVNKTAKTYQNGAWVNWTLMLYEPGNTHEATTGGYQAVAVRYAETWDGNPLKAIAPVITQGSSSMVVSLSNSNSDNRSGSALTVNEIDLSPFSKITFECSFSFGSTGNAVRFYVTGSDSSYTPVAETIVQGNNVPASGRVVVNLPSGISGSYFVGMNLLAGALENVTTRVTVSRITCE